MASLLAAGLAEPSFAQRERLSINDGWRFQQGDPAGSKTDLNYEVRPEIKLRADGADFDAGGMGGSNRPVAPAL